MPVPVGPYGSLLGGTPGARRARPSLSLLRFAQESTSGHPALGGPLAPERATGPSRTDTARPNKAARLSLRGRATSAPGRCDRPTHGAPRRTGTLRVPCLATLGPFRAGGRVALRARRTGPRRPAPPHRSAPVALGGFAPCAPGKTDSSDLCGRHA